MTHQHSGATAQEGVLNLPLRKLNDLAFHSSRPFCLICKEFQDSAVNRIGRGVFGNVIAFGMISAVMLSGRRVARLMRRRMS